jgi:hypothetical protein
MHRDKTSLSDEWYHIEFSHNQQASGGEATDNRNVERYYNVVTCDLRVGGYQLVDGAISGG